MASSGSDGNDMASSSGGDGNDGKEAVSSQSPAQELLTISETLTSLSLDSVLPAVSLPNIPSSDLVLEILFRLPVKTVAQLRCLGKSWNSLISNPKFARQHIGFSRTLETRHHLILVFKDNETDEFHICDTGISSGLYSISTIPEMKFRYPLTLPKLHGVIIGTCDGLICFTNSDDYSSYLVWNPCINKFKISPPLEYQSDEYRKVYGFGYDRFTKAYKVIVICVLKQGISDLYNWFPKTQVNVYTLGTNSWRRIQDFTFGKLGYFDSGKFVSGAIHWLAETGNRSWAIVSLDLGNESYGVILQPNYGKVGAVHLLTLGVLRDCLCVLAHFDKFWDVWVMEDYGKEVSWTQLFTIRCSVFGYTSAFHGHAHYLSLDDQLLLKFHNEVVVYNSKIGTAIKFCHTQHGWVKSLHLDVYIESLISP